MNNTEVEHPNPHPELGFPDLDHQHHDDHHDQTAADDPLHEELQNHLSLEEAEPEAEEDVREEIDYDKDDNFGNFGDVKREKGNEEDEDGWGGYVAEENNYNGWDDDLAEKDGDGYGYGYGYGWDDAEEKKDEESSNVNGGEANENGDGFNSYSRYPVRPGAEDCAFYMKTGNCKFGSECKFNHPVQRKPQGAKDKVNEREDGMENPSQSQSQSKTECKYYLRTGGCKFGKACRYNHSRLKSPTLFEKTAQPPVLELNFLGLPIRLGERECPYYMRTGSCKFGSNCKFNHPDPTTVGGGDPPSTFSNGGSASLPNSSQSTIASWSSPRSLNETIPYVPIMFPPAQGVPSQGPKWNGYQTPLYSPERSLRLPPAFVMSNPAAGANVYANQQQQMVVDEFPERPGQPECSYYMKTGDCKYKSNCKYHHPKNRISKSAPCALSDKGLPLRPDQNICSHYSRYGICKFGPACRFDHPIDSTASVARAETRVAENGNDYNAGSQQTL